MWQHSDCPVLRTMGTFKELEVSQSEGRRPRGHAGLTTTGSHGKFPSKSLPQYFHTFFCNCKLKTTHSQVLFYKFSHSTTKFSNWALQFPDVYKLLKKRRWHTLQYNFTYIAHLKLKVHQSAYVGKHGSVWHIPAIKFKITFPLLKTF